MKKGTAVTYEGNDGEQLALVLKPHNESTVDLITFDNNTGAAGVQRSVPRRDEGGGHTWKPIS